MPGIFPMLKVEQAGLSAFASDTFFTDVVAVAPRVQCVGFFDANRTACRISVDPKQIFRRVYFGIWATGTRTDQTEILATLSFARNGKKFRTEEYAWWSPGSGLNQNLSFSRVKLPFSATERTAGIPGNPMPLTAGALPDELLFLDNFDGQSATIFEVRLAPYRTVEACDEIFLEGVVGVGAASIPQFRLFLACHSSVASV
jgi:hypothetical protein